MQRGRAFKRLSNTQEKARFGIQVKSPRNLELSQGLYTMFNGSERFVEESGW